MSSERLTPTSYTVLGMMALRGPTTPYDLKRAIGRSVGYFWKFPHTQLYDEPARLADLGLLSVTQEDEGRRRRTYTITDAGLTALRAWLKEPTSEHFQLRSEAELKLFFSEVGDAGDVRALAQEQVRTHEERLRIYEDIQHKYSPIPQLSSRLIPLSLGIALEKTALGFWRDLAERARLSPGRDAADPSSARGGATAARHMRANTPAAVS
jgi:PadR family transcriptional regulator, regulatory protein AphA